MRSRRRTVVAVAGFSCFAFAFFFCGWSACEDRVRHAGGGSLVLEAIPSARGRRAAQGFVPVPGAEATTKRPVTRTAR